MPPTTCWICGTEDAATREHLVKASDLKALYGKPSQAEPLFLNANPKPGRPRRRNVRVGSLKADALKFTHRICQACNSTRTQLYDYAWEHASNNLSQTLTPLLQSGGFRANRLFPYNTVDKMLKVHLYFTKLFGCLIAEGKVPIDIAPFAEALMSGHPHPNLYLAFGHLRLPITAAGGSDLHVLKREDGTVVCAAWLYNVGDLAVRVMYAIDGVTNEGLRPAWHPRMGAKRLSFTDFSSKN